MRIRSVAVIALAVAGASCGNEPLATQDIIGDYTATAFTVTPTGQPSSNVLTAGGSLTITLAPSGTTTGQLVIPASLNGGTALSESMDGTFTLNGSTVSFSQAADTFVRDTDFSVTNNRLVGSATFSGVSISVTLTRQ